MTNKERVHLMLQGGQLDRPLVTAPYIMLSNADHWTDITGRSVADFYRWESSFDEEEILAVYRKQIELLPFDFVHPYFVPDVETRRARTVIEKDGKVFLHDARTDETTEMPDSIHEAGSGGGENEECFVDNEEDARRVIEIKSADQILAEGIYDHSRLVVGEFGKEHFIVTGGVVNTFYSNVYWMGMETFLERLVTEPELIHYCNELSLQKNYGMIDAFAKIGGDAVQIDDALSTSEMISLKMYEEFSLPSLKKLVKRIQSHGMKAILIYFGGIDDRAKLIASTGADILFMETPMKTYRNDYAEISPQVGNMCLATNLNPYLDIEIASDSELAARVSQMKALGQKHGKYIISTGSPLTPHTTIARMQNWIKMCQQG